MANQNENAIAQNSSDNSNFDTNLDELEKYLQDSIDDEFSESENIDSEIAKVNNPESLGTVVYDTIWEQVRNQIGVQAGEDFVKDSYGQSLDLRSSAHIQTTENFVNGKIASHNHDIDYQKRYDDWQNNFQKNEDGSVKTKYDPRSSKNKQVLKKDARKDFDEGRSTGKLSKNTNMDHTIPAAEIIRDPEVAAHLSREEQVKFANSEKNLNEIDSSINQSKSDLSMDEWLDSKRDGKKPSERFPIDEEELRKKDKEARKEYEKQKKEGENRSIESGKKSQKAEAKCIAGKAGRAIVMNLLADLVKTIVRKFIAWLSSTGKTLKTLLTTIKDAIVDFVLDFKQKVINIADSAATVIATSILGPVISTIKKAWMFLKQGYESVKEAILYLKNPENKDKPISYKLMEVGKIVMGGLTVAGAVVLGEVIEKGLSTIPIFAFEIPLLGSLANIIGIFLGAIVSGLIGALAINLINRLIAKKMKSDLVDKQVEKLNDVLETQDKLLAVKDQKLTEKKEELESNVKTQHTEVGKIMTNSVSQIMKDKKDVEKTSKELEESDKKFEKKVSSINDDLVSLM